MDYNELKQNYPQAFDQFVNWHRKYFDLSMFSGFPKLDLGLLEQIIDDDDSNLTRDLYDFFDEQGIYISAKPIIYELENRILIQCDINLVGIQKDGFAMKKLALVGVFGAPTRPEAEEAAFTKAFEILEQQLNKQI